jgi:MoaA/NifB/PqqE/SkfB family radical SAM enzyme
MKLEDIGFYTLSNARAKQSSMISPLWRCELILTDQCNFNCPYCRGLKPEYKGDIPWHEAAYIITQWQKEGLKNIRFSGGEPTLYSGLTELVSLAKKSCERIAISTNGSASLDLYETLIKKGVNDFSVSLDSCCSSTCDKMSGTQKMFDKVTKAIEYLAKKTYVTVGIVATETNLAELEYIIDVADSLGVSDIRIIPAAQFMKTFDIPINMREKYPILKYRINNMKDGRNIRGLRDCDTEKCSLVLDDMAVVGNHHYPCIIYLREGGKPIGNFTTIEQVRFERFEWAVNHNCKKDEICKNNCLDVCVDYNNKFFKEK